MCARARECTITMPSIHTDIHMNTTTNELAQRVLSLFSLTVDDLEVLAGSLGLVRHWEALTDEPL